MTYSLHVAGENIEAGDSVVISWIDKKLYVAGAEPGEFAGNAVERIREGFRAQVAENGDVREDDA